MELSSVLLLAIVGLIGFACQWLAWRVQLPAILFLLLTGIVLGPVTSFLQPDELFGNLLFPFVSLSVAIILFEGSLTLRRSELTEIGSVVRNLVTVGALVNAVITSVAVHWLTGMPWPLACLFGAIMIVTGPTVIMPMIRSVKPNPKIANALRWESIVIDPLGAIFAVLVFEWIVAQQTNTELTHVATVFFETVLLGSVAGAAGGYGYGLLLRHHLIPEYLHNFSAVAMVCAVFAISESVMHESGLLAVTVMGIWLANMPDVNVKPILEFKETLTVMFVSALFILLAARLDVAALQTLGWSALGVLLVMQFISRPLKVWLSTLGSTFNWRERALLAWIGPRGIVAAAVSALFAIRLESFGFEMANLLVPLVFSVIIGTVLIQSTTARFLAQRLDVCDVDTRGFLIIGANVVARAIGEALTQAGVRVILTDNYWDNISAARAQSLPTYYGNPMSDHAELYMDLSGIGGMLGLSHYQERNTAAALRFRDDFEHRDVYVLRAQNDTRAHDKHRAGRFYRGRSLFNDEVTYNKLASLISLGAVVKKSKLSESFDYSVWQEHYRERNAIPLFVVTPDGVLKWFTQDEAITPKPGWTIFALAEAEDPAE